MEANRESNITFKSGNYNPENAKFKFCVRIDIGNQQYAEKAEKIKAMGITPAKNVVVIVKDFENEEGAKKLPPLIEQFKAGGMLGPLTELAEPIKVEGAKCIIPVRLPPQAVAMLSMLHAINDALGDLSSKHQFIELSFSEGRTIKDIISDPVISPLAVALNAICLQFKLSIQKELPIKLGTFAAGLAPETERAQIKLASELLAAFHHLKFELEIAEPGEALKQAFKNEILAGLMGMAQMAIGMATQFGVMEIAKDGKGLTTAYLCLDPLISLDFTLDATTAFEALEKLATPPPS
jgi:hypothetical protein